MMARTVDTLADEVLLRIEEHRCCPNGGFGFYADRGGDHVVSIDPIEEGATA